MILLALPGFSLKKTNNTEMAKFYPLKVSDVRRETSDTVSVSFEIPENYRQDFSYKAGQYLTLKMVFDGEEVRRSYSLSSSPELDKEYRIAVKQVPGGKMSSYLNNKLKPGEVIESMPPDGNFIVEDNSAVRHYIGFAAGSGITPVISILKSVAASDNGSKFTLFYGNKSLANVIFKAELDALAEKYPAITVVYVFSRESQTNPLLDGRISGSRAIELINRYCADEFEKEYYICGPEELIMQVSESLQSNGADKKNIHFELFTTPVQSIQAAPKAESSFTGNAKIKVISDDEEYEFELASNGINILDASMKAGVDAPFSCKGAVCCTCKAKILEGEAIMDMNYALSEGEVEQGYILTCQAHPASQKLTISYDEA